MEERLTHKKNNCWQLKKAGNAMCKEICAEHTDGCEKCPIAEAIDRLAAYEDAEADGLLVRLPCKPGEEVVLLSKKRIIDVCCGSRMFWFDKSNPDVEFCDNRELHATLCDGRTLDVSPDTIADFRNLPFPDNSYYLAVFDPPHFVHAGSDSWTAQKYGTLPKDWMALLHDGFEECMRVLKPNGVLIFKWNEYQIPVRDVIKAVGHQPLFGHRSGKQQQTHWLCFMAD